MAIDSTITAAVYTGNASTVTPYVVPFEYLDAADVYVTQTAQGSGTVTVAAGVVTFSAAQAALVIGSKIRIADVIYEIATRASDTSFTFKTRPTISATAFHHVESATTLAADVDYVLSGSDVVTTLAVPATSLLTIYRATARLQPSVLPLSGALPASTLETIADRLTMIAQDMATLVSGSGVGLGAAGSILAGNVTFLDAAARALAVPSGVGQYGFQLSDSTYWVSSGLTAGQWVSAIPANCLVLNNITPDADGNVTVSRADGTFTTKIPYIP